MRITEINTYRMQVPLKVPFRTALRTVENLESIVVEVLTDSGHIGRGEAPATAVITGDTLPSIAWAIEGVIGPAVIGRDIMELEELMHWIQTGMVHNSSAKAALDMAVYDLFAQNLHVPLWKLLGGYRSKFETDMTISVNPVEQMIEDSLRAVAEGYRVLKVKVGKDWEEDIQRVAQIHYELPSSVRLRIDANQGWSAKTAVRVIRNLEEQGIKMEFVEQPVPAMDLEGLRYVTEQVHTPILADEAVFSVRDAAELIRMRAADLLNIKLMKTGGLYNALTICNLAEAHGISCMIGCMLEGGIAATAAAHLAGGKSNIGYADLDGPILGKTNPVVGGASFDGPMIRLSEEPGLGIMEVRDLRRIHIQG